MKSKSLLSLTAALLLCTASVSFAQDVSGSASGSAGVSVGSGTVTGGATVTGSGSGSTDGTSVGVGAGAGVDVSLDTNGDGTVDEDEQAAGGNPGTGGTSSGGTATGGTGTSGGVDLDTNGDGTISAEEQAAGVSDIDEASPSGIEDCSVIDAAGFTSMGSDQIMMIDSATSINVVRLSDCEGDRGADLNSDVEAALFGNETIANQLAQEGVGNGEIIAVSASDGTITVYLAQDDSETDGDGSVTGTESSGEGTGTEGGTSTGTSSQ